MSALLQAHGDMVRALGRHMVEGPRGLRGVQNLIVTVIRDAAWRDFIAPATGERFVYGPEEFARFVAAPPFGGLGTDVATVRALCEGDEEAVRAIDAATHTATKRGRPKKGSDTTLLAGERGREYQISRLKRDNQDLAEMVVNGEMSAWTAAHEAGFRKRATPLDNLRKAWVKATEAERAAFLAEVSGG